MLLISSSTTLAIDAGDPTSLVALRRAIESQLAPSHLLVAAIPTVQLIACELVANVKKHCDDHRCTIRLDLSDAVYLEVHDTSPHLPTLRPTTITDEHGRGLHLLTALTRTWGATPTPTGKRVWCEITANDHAPS